MCAADSQLVCILCIATTHHTHPCKSVDEFFLEKRSDVDKLIASAKQQSARIQAGIDRVKREKDAISGSKQDLNNNINTYFAKVREKK